LQHFSFGGYGLALAALALVVFGAIECPPNKVLSKNKIPVLKNAITILSVKPKRGWYVFWLFFQDTLMFIGHITRKVSARAFD